MAETEMKFEMTATTLARAVAGGAARERRRAAKLVQDRADTLLGTSGDVALYTLLYEIAEAIRATDTATPLPAMDREALEPIVEEATEDELPPVHHTDDFSDGQALVANGAYRRLVVGYNGASGHLRD